MTRETFSARYSLGQSARVLHVTDAHAKSRDVIVANTFAASEPTLLNARERKTSSPDLGGNRGTHP